VEKYILKGRSFTSFLHFPNQLLSQKRNFIFMTVVLMLLLLLSTPAFAAVEGILTTDKDGSYHHYCYRDLIDSYTSLYRGNPDGLYEDYIAKKPVALLDSVNGYVDFNDVINQYAHQLLRGQSVTIDEITERAQIKRAEMPERFYLVSSEAGKLVRHEESFTGQGGVVVDYEEPAKDEGEKSSGEIDNPTGKTAIVSVSSVSLSQAQTWAQRKNSHQRFIDIAPLYWEYGKKTGIRPEVLYAQAAYETGYGRYTGQVPASFNNWAGIKNGNSNGNEPEDHQKFATPEDGVRGHFNHMSAYVGLKPIGEPHDRYYSVKSIGWAGTVEYIEELSGKWAPSSTYHETIVRMIGEMK